VRRPGQGEALVACALWGATTLAVLVTYSRLDPAELYHTSHDGLAGGLSRSLVLLNFPVALVAIALVLVAVGALPRAVWWVAGAAIALCAIVAWPGVVDQDDLDARPINAVPTLGLLLALALTMLAARRAGASFAPRLIGDHMRIAAAAVVIVLSLPWVAAEVGFHLPGDVFLGEEPYREKDGTVLAAVHLGHHHGLDGALLVLTALLLSRPRPAGRRLRAALAVYLGLMFAYGAVNFAQDFWLEQVVKRGWTDASIPSALVPGARPIWLVVLALAALATFGLLRERDRVTTRAS
jgi:hypothetical protein